MVRIDYFFTPISGFSYLGHDEALALAARHGVRMALRPIDSNALYAAIDVTPPPKQPARRLRYRQADMARWAAWRGQPLVIEPRFWPTDSALAARAIVAVQARGGDAGPFAGGLLKAVWERDLDIAAPETIRRVAQETGLDPDTVLAEAAAPATLATYQANTAEAIARGALGSPTFFVGDAMIFGQDRMHFLDALLAEATVGGRAAPRP